jgi:hypothetical protein
MRCLLTVLAALASASVHAQESKYYEVPKGDYPHDVAVGPGGEVWYAGQNLSGAIERIPLGKKSAPHGVIVGPDGAPWFTDGGQNNAHSSESAWFFGSFSKKPSKSRPARVGYVEINAKGGAEYAPTGSVPAAASRA